MEVLLEVGRFDMDGGVELTMIHTYIDVQKCDFGGGSHDCQHVCQYQEGDKGGENGPGKLDRVATIEALKEEEKGIMTMSSQQEDINKPEPKVRFRVF